jgi:hypothetical protein
VRRAILAGAVAMAIVLPAGWAGAKVARPITPAAKPKAHVGRTHRAMKVGNTNASVKTRKTKAKARKPGGSARRVTKSGAKTSGGGEAGVGNPTIGGLQTGTRQRKNGHTGLRVGGNAGGAPVRTGLGL